MFTLWHVSESEAKSLLDLTCLSFTRMSGLYAPPWCHSSCGAYPQWPAAARGAAAGGLGRNDCTPFTITYYKCYGGLSTDVRSWEFILIDNKRVNAYFCNLR